MKGRVGAITRKKKNQLNIQIVIFFAALITFLKFAGNLVALRPRFHSYVVSVY